MKIIRPITLFLAVAFFTGGPPNNENDAAAGDAITLDDCEKDAGERSPARLECDLVARGTRVADVLM